MAPSAADNVIQFNTARDWSARRRDLKPESLDVIQDCRDIALKRITALLATTFDKIEDELFELASASRDRESQNMYLDARNQAREKRGDIEIAFRKQFVSYFEKKVTREESDKSKSTGLRFDAMELSLVEDDALSEDIAVNDIAKRLTNKCDEELRALSQRMGFLLSEPELADDANPMSPDTVVKALKAACDQMTAGFQTKLTVLRLVEQHMAQDMLTVYRDINSHLVARQILPTIRPTYRRAPTSGARTGAQGSSQANVPVGNASNAAPGAEFQAYPAGGMGGAAGVGGAPLSAADAANHAAQDIFHTLQQLMAGGVSFDRGAGATTGFHQAPAGINTGAFAPAPSFGGFGPAAMASSAHAGLSATSSFSSDALIAALSQVQQHLMTDQNSIGAAAVQAMQNFVPGETPVASLNVLRQIKNEGLVQGGNQLDAMTIDIVAMLFDYVFDDRAIPDAIKALIARLQIPVLKVAILDKTFFSKKNHAVRRLLDALADASVGFSPEATKQDPLYQKIESIVDRVHANFERDLSLFDTMHAEFVEFLAEREKANAEIVEQSARALHEREKREMARLLAQAEVEPRAAASDLPSPVSAMLRGPWARVLERLYLREGGRNERFTEALATADRLVWSVQPKADAVQRKELVAALPALLRALQEGLEIAAVEQDDRTRFFAALVDCHAVAVKAGLRGESVAQLFTNLRPNAETAPLFEKLIAEEKEREAQAREIQRSGVARIHFTDNGVDIEEIVPNRVAQAMEESASSSSHVVASESIGDAPIAKPESANVGTESVSGAHAQQTETHADLDLPVPELQRGTWVEFIHEGTKKIRAKLSWVSPLKGVYLFTNPGATEALSIAPEALQHQLRRGIARVLEESSLMDRAVDRMVNSLSGGR